ncbi:MAG TPA: hypothetical protein VER33_17420 [Polyangiaceae bacterium]|nr:hypothetical protein [Polyangiaceae bacterium]
MSEATSTSSTKYVPEKDVFAIGDAVLQAAREDRATLSEGIPSAPLLGALPVARVIPQDVHSVMDYVNAAGAGAGALMTDDPQARAASLVLGCSGAAVSAITDYRLSVAKLVPIEAHEVIDYLWGISAMAAPFVLGYHKRAKAVAATHFVLGMGTVLASLVTDYRAAVGVGHRARAAE